jgi:hypothetical protein
MRWLVSVTVAAALVGCGTRQTSVPSSDSQSALAKRVVKDFQFLRFSMSWCEITNQVGAPDRIVGSGQQRWEYDLADGTQLVIMPTQDPTNMVVYWYGQCRGDQWLWTRSREGQ